MCGIQDGGRIYFIDMMTGDPISTFNLACLLSSGALVTANVLERNAAESIESDVDVLTVTEGCISYASQINDGVCRTAGQFISCVDAYWYEAKDCIVHPKE